MHYTTWESGYYATTYAAPAYYTDAPKYYSTPAHYTEALKTTLHPATYPQLRRPSISVPTYYTAAATSYYDPNYYFGVPFYYTKIYVAFSYYTEAPVNCITKAPEYYTTT
jgi:hypothetical protein